MTVTQLEIVQDAAGEWREQLAAADRARYDVITAVILAAAGGVSEYRLAAAAGVTRQTIRAWLGKGGTNG